MDRGEHHERLQRIGADGHLGGKLGGSGAAGRHCPVGRNARLCLCRSVRRSSRLCRKNPPGAALRLGRRGEPTREPVHGETCEEGAAEQMVTAAAP